MSFKERAEKVLKEHLAEIKTVEQWSEKMGYNSVNYFSRKIRDAFDQRPKKIIIEVKLQYIEEQFRKDKNQNLFAVARALGFANDGALYHFIKRHRGKSPLEWKEEYEK
jgi:AraC-like DNA-binding protein